MYMYVCMCMYIYIYIYTYCAEPLEAVALWHHWPDKRSA